MGLVRYALAFGLGYAAGTPAGREKLKGLPAQLSALAQRPEAKQVQEKGKAVAGKAVGAAKERLSGTSSDDSTTGEHAATPTRPAWRSLGRRNRPTVIEETVVVTEAAPVLTDDPEAATQGTLPPAGPRR
jgi:hypothetical protein